MGHVDGFALKVQEARVEVADASGFVEGVSGFGDLEEAHVAGDSGSRRGRVFGNRVDLAEAEGSNEAAEGKGPAINVRHDLGLRQELSPELLVFLLLPHLEPPSSYRTYVAPGYYLGVGSGTPGPRVVVRLPTRLEC